MLIFLATTFNCSSRVSDPHRKSSVFGETVNCLIMSLQSGRLDSSSSTGICQTELTLSSINWQQSIGECLSGEIGSRLNLCIELKLLHNRFFGQYVSSVLHRYTVIQLPSYTVTQLHSYTVSR